MLEHLRETDHGTPRRESTEEVTLTIDGNAVTVAKGTSLMRAAVDAGIKVPKLCATDSLEPFGSCRLCLVEIDGRKGFPASCTTPAEAGMNVRTQTPKLQELRKGVMELYISDHPLDCLTCSANGNCELQDMAGVTGLRNVRYGFEGANHLKDKKDESNPYFTYDPSKCIVCNRCVRACEETQGTFALTISGRGFESRVSAGQDQPFMESECVSCGACVEACPTATLQEKSVIWLGQSEHSAITTCAYCGVGCGFKAEMKGNEVVRMVPWKDGKANEGHSCVKGRFAWGYATHKDRITKPMIRKSIADEWQEVSWDEAIGYAASEFRRIQAKYGRDAIGGITSSRCTNEETYLVQKLVRAAFGNNNVDTCARVCHSPTGYGLGQTFGTSAGTQTFKSVEKADVIMVIGANPAAAHPVFASRMKRRLRQGARLIVVDPRQIDLVKSPHVQADFHLQLKPGTNVAVITAMAHVIVTEGLVAGDYVNERCDEKSFREWKEFVARPENSPEAMERVSGVPAETLRGAARLYATGGNAAIYYGLGVTEHAQGSTMVMGIANLAMVTGNVGREGVGVNPLRGQNNVQGSCDMGSFPHELPGYRHISDTTVRSQFEAAWGVELSPEPGLRIPNMFDAAQAGSFMGLYCEGEDIVQSDPNTQHVAESLMAMECIVVQDIFLNETAKYAHVFLPGASFLEKDGTFTNAERRISRVTQVMPPKAGYADWEVTQLLSNALGYPMNYAHPREIMAEIASLTPTFAGVSYEKIEQHGSLQWPCNDSTLEIGTPIMHIGKFVRGKGRFIITQYVASDEKVTQRFPLLLTTGRILSQYNVGAQTRRTPNNQWHSEDRLEIHPQDAEDRGINEGDWVGIQSRAGETVLRATVTERIQPGVVYTTFHFPESGANVITTDSSDWATNCPEYKVTAVQVMPVAQPSQWQKSYSRFNAVQLGLLDAAARKPAAAKIDRMNPNDAPLVPPAGLRHVAVTAQRAGVQPPAQPGSHDWVAEEVPVALEYNGVSHAVMLATPLDLEDFALGFSLTEDIIGGIGDVRDIEVVPGPQGITVQLQVSPACFAQLKDRRRSLAGRTGCGLCGTESLPQAVRTPPPLQSDARFEAAAVARAMQALRGRQPLHEATGATHAAAFARADGGLLLVREDVGRHNALDKLIGALMQAREPAHGGFIAVTSRASYEMAGKAARAGAPLLVAVSGVTGLAIDVAQGAGLTLVGFARGDDLSAYSHAERILWNLSHGQ